MGDDALTPSDPRGFIQRCVRERKVFWTHHINMRMKDRAITRAMIVDTLAGYEIIEAYSEDKYLPSYLVLARHGEIAIHVLFATDTKNENVRVVTAYRPSPEEWNTDMRTRKNR